MPEDINPEKQNSGSGPAPALHFGLNFAVAMALFSFAGHKLDQRKGHGSAFTLAGIFLGLMYGGYEVWKLTRQPPESDEEKDSS
jgi:uncharacterized membrane protein YkvI